MRNLKFIKLFESFDETETIKEGAYKVSDLSALGREFESPGQYLNVNLGSENDILHIKSNTRYEGGLLISIFLKCYNVDELLADFKKYPDSEKSDNLLFAGRKCMGSISVTGDGEFQVQCHQGKPWGGKPVQTKADLATLEDWHYSNYATLIYKLLNKYVWKGEGPDGMSQLGWIAKFEDELETKARQAIRNPK